MKNKEEFLNKIIDDLPIAEYRSQMTKDEWKGWFEDAYNEGYKQAQALQLQQTGVKQSVFYSIVDNGSLLEKFKEKETAEYALEEYKKMGFPDATILETVA